MLYWKGCATNAVLIHCTEKIVREFAVVEENVGQGKYVQEDAVRKILDREMFYRKCCTGKCCLGQWCSGDAIQKHSVQEKD